MFNQQDGADKLSPRTPRVTKTVLNTALVAASNNESYEWRVIDILDAMRLEQPSNPNFRYVQKYRLYGSATRAAIEAIDQVRRIMQSLPASYQLQIINNPEFGRFDERVQKTLTIKENRQEGDEPLVFNRYSQMLFDGIRGILSLVNPELKGLFLRELDPFLTTMEALSAFERSIRPQTKAPPFIIPQDIRNSLPYGAFANR